MFHEVRQRAMHFFALFVGQRHLLQAFFQFLALAFIVAQALFVFAQGDKVVAVVALFLEPDKAEQHSTGNAEHNHRKHSPEKTFVTTDRLQPHMPAIGKLLYLIILTVQTGNQADGPGTVDSTALHQRVSMRKGLFVVHQSSIGRFRAGCQPQKENQQEKKEGMFHLEILRL